MKNKKKLNIFLFVFLVIIIVFVTCILEIQDSMFFYPWHDQESYNKLLNNDNFKEIKIDNDGRLLHGWFKYNCPQDKSAPLLIFFGGNAQSSANTCVSFLYSDIYKYFNNYNIIIVDYPGYGLSEGTPSDKTMFDAGLKVYDYASELNTVDKNNIVVLGFSIGTGVATYVASERSVNGLILLAPYDRALSLYNDTLNIFHGPLKILAKYKFDSISYAPKVQVSPLIFTSYKDEIINYKLSINLSKNFNNVEQFIILEDVMHNYYFSNEIVLKNIYYYLQQRL